MEFLPTAKTSLSLSTKAQNHYRRDGGRMITKAKMGEVWSKEQCLLDITGFIHEFTAATVACTRLEQDQANQHSSMDVERS